MSSDGGTHMYFKVYMRLVLWNMHRNFTKHYTLGNIAGHCEHWRG